MTQGTAGEGFPTGLGHVAPGYEGVRDAFESNFTRRDELGAAFAAYVDGECVVDLWGGLADRPRRRPWERDTLQLIFSGTKGLAATAVAVLCDRVEIELEQPVAHYWPEFAQQGKAAITVGEALSHQAGVPNLPRGMTADDFLDASSMARVIAASPALWPRGSRVAYHGLTFSWIVGELVARVTGLSIGEFFAAEIAAPLRLEAWIGLPEALEPRVGNLEMSSDYSGKWHADAELVAQLFGGVPIFDEPLIWNRRDFHAAELAASNAIASARAVAAMYGCLACGGESPYGRLVKPTTLDRCVRERVRGVDALSGDQVAFAVGFELQTPSVSLGPTANAFGHGGAGGSIHGAWPAHRTGFSYVMNQLREEVTDDRSRVLLASLFAAVAQHGDHTWLGAAG